MYEEEPDSQTELKEEDYLSGEIEDNSETKKSKKPPPKTKK